MESKAKYTIQVRGYPTLDHWGNINKGWSGFIATWEPGDGTKYQLWGQRVEDIDSFGCLGSVERGWMVVCSLNARAYLFQGSGDLATEYVAEHLGLDNAVSALKITALLGFALERQTDVEVRVEKKDSSGKQEKADDN